MTSKEALSRIASHCAIAERCKYDIEEKLKKWELSDGDIKQIINLLEKENYINEERFCRAYVNDKFRFSKWGKLKIRQGLQLKRVSTTAIYEALDTIDTKEYIDTLDAIISAKRKSIKAKNQYEFNNKLIRFALSRGFEMVDIYQILNNIDEFE